MRDRDTVEMLWRDKVRRTIRRIRDGIYPANGNLTAVTTQVVECLKRKTKKPKYVLRAEVMEIITAMDMEGEFDTAVPKKKRKP